MDVKYEVIICTVNRPRDFERTVHSVFSISNDIERLVTVDAGSPETQAENARTLRQLGGSERTLHLPFTGRPSLARQRNVGLEALRADTAIVHFLDDDVTLQPGYFEVINTLLMEDPMASGAGGRVVEPDRERRDSDAFRALAARAFLLDSRRPGRILRSGWTTPPQAHDLTNRVRVQWLSGCGCAYKCRMMRDLRFDDRLEGYSLDEDLDFSFTVSKRGSLWFTPDTQLVHHRSAANRMNSRELARDAIIHRYWFVRKNLPGSSGLAFRWSLLGKRLAMLTSNAPESLESIEGFKEGIAAIRNRDHYLLSDSAETSS